MLRVVDGKAEFNGFYFFYFYHCSNHAFIVFCYFTLKYNFPKLSSCPSMVDFSNQKNSYILSCWYFNVMNMNRTIKSQMLNQPMVQLSYPLEYLTITVNLPMGPWKKVWSDIFESLLGKLTVDLFQIFGQNLNTPLLKIRGRELCKYDQLASEFIDKLGHTPCAYKISSI